MTEVLGCSEMELSNAEAIMDWDLELEDEILDIFREDNEGNDNGFALTSSSAGSTSSGSGSDSETSSEASFQYTPRPMYIGEDCFMTSTTNSPVFIDQSSKKTMLHSSEMLDQNKRMKIESRLIKNRESANKSRIKRKMEKINMEQSLSELQKRVIQLEQENSALMADNAALSCENSKLKQQLREKDNNGSMLGMSVFCVVCAFSFVFGTSTNDVFPTESRKNTSGRVLLSFDEDVHRFRSPFGAESNLGYSLMISLAILAVGFVVYFAVSRKSRQAILPS